MNLDRRDSDLLWREMSSICRNLTLLWRGKKLKESRHGSIAARQKVFLSHKNLLARDIAARWRK
jgi:hypothetical protein